MPDRSLVAAHNGQESGNTGAELLVCLNTRLTVSKNAGLFSRLNKVWAKVLCCSRNGESFYLAWKPRCLGTSSLGAEEARDV